MIDHCGSEQISDRYMERRYTTQQQQSRDRGEAQKLQPRLGMELKIVQRLSGIVQKGGSHAGQQLPQRTLQYIYRRMYSQHIHAAPAQASICGTGRITVTLTKGSAACRQQYTVCVMQQLVRSLCLARRLLLPAQYEFSQYISRRPNGALSCQSNPVKVWPFQILRIAWPCTLLLLFLDACAAWCAAALPGHRVASIKQRARCLAQLLCCRI